VPQYCCPLIPRVLGLTVAVIVVLITPPFSLRPSFCQHQYRPLLDFVGLHFQTSLPFGRFDFFLVPARTPICFSHGRLYRHVIRCSFIPSAAPNLQLIPAEVVGVFFFFAHFPSLSPLSAYPLPFDFSRLDTPNQQFDLSPPPGPRLVVAADFRFFLTNFGQSHPSQSRTHCVFSCPTSDGSAHFSPWRLTEEIHALLEFSPAGELQE